MVVLEGRPGLRCGRVVVRDAQLMTTQLSREFVFQKKNLLKISWLDLSRSWKRVLTTRLSRPTPSRRGKHAWWTTEGRCWCACLLTRVLGVFTVFASFEMRSSSTQRSRSLDLVAVHFFLSWDTDGCHLLYWGFVQGVARVTYCLSWVAFVYLLGGVFIPTLIGRS